MGKHAFLTASFQCLARSLLVLEPTEHEIPSTILQVCGGLHVCVLHPLIIQKRLDTLFICTVNHHVLQNAS